MIYLHTKQNKLKEAVYIGASYESAPKAPFSHLRLAKILRQFTSVKAPKKIGSFLSFAPQIENTITANFVTPPKLKIYSYTLASLGKLSPLKLASEGIKKIFPTNIEHLKVINDQIGGSTGAKLVEDKQKRQYVLKTAGTDAIIHPEHLKAEYYTNKAYQALGVSVPEVALYNRKTGVLIKKVEGAIEKSPQGAPLAMLSKFIPGRTVELQEYLQKHPERLEEVQKLVQSHFVADCLLANWDVIGLTFDNIRIDLDTKMIWRVDNGSGLAFRAQGGLKGDKFTDYVGELDSLRNPNINHEAATIFDTISDEEIVRQIDEIQPLREQFLSSLPKDLVEKMSKRFDSLQEYKRNLVGVLS